MNREFLIELQLRFLIDNHQDYLQKIDEVLQEYFPLTYINKKKQESK